MDFMDIGSRRSRQLTFGMLSRSSINLKLILENVCKY